MKYKHSKQLNKYQMAVARAYGDGDFAWLVQSKSWRKDIKSVGDTMFAFLMIELSGDEMCDGWEEAIRRVDFAMRDLEVSINALIKEKMNDDAKSVARRKLKARGNSPEVCE